MSIRLLGACASLAFLPLGTAAAAATPTTKAVVPSDKAEDAKAPKMNPAEVMAGMLVMLDRFFPAGPEPEPARLELGRTTALTMFPKGSHASGVSGFMEGMVDRVLDMSEADLAGIGPIPKPKKGDVVKPPSRVPLRAELAKKDPKFDAKVAAGKAFARTMFEKFGEVAEPKFREGMARSLARKFDARQLGEIQAFLATPTGAAYGRQMVGLWFDPEIMRGTVQAIPQMMELMPELMKEGEAFDKLMKDTARPAAGK